MGISVQFHAMPLEILRLFADLFVDDAIFCSEAFGAPVKFSHLDKGVQPDFDENRRAIAFSMDQPNVSVSSIYEFRERNPNALLLELGQISTLGLTESWLSANTDNSSCLARWRKVAKNLHTATLSGATAMNPNNGTEVPIKWHRFTKEARLAFQNGMAMLPSAGKSIIRFP